MTLNKTLQKIQEQLEQRNWSMYKLAKEANIPYSSLNALFQKNNQPTLSTLEKICTGLNLTMYEFFLDYPPYRESDLKLNDNEKCLLEMYQKLDRKNQKLLFQFAEIMLKCK